MESLIRLVHAHRHRQSVCIAADFSWYFQRRACGSKTTQNKLRFHGPIEAMSLGHMMCCFCQDIAFRKASTATDCFTAHKVFFQIVELVMALSQAALPSKK